VSPGIFTGSARRLAESACRAALQERLDRSVRLYSMARLLADRTLAREIEYNLGTLSMRIGPRRQKAAELLRSAAELGEGAVAARSWLNLGAMHDHFSVVHGSQRRSRSAEVAFLRGIGLRAGPYSEECRNNLGVVYASRGDARQAKAAWRRTLRSGVETADAAAAFNLGVQLSRLGKMDMAREAYERAAGSDHIGISSAVVQNLSMLDKEKDGSFRQVQIGLPLDVAYFSPYIRLTEPIVTIGRCAPVQKPLRLEIANVTSLVTPGTDCAED
jgi:tetratricopeptide (TPR) repeat protein